MGIREDQAALRDAAEELRSAAASITIATHGIRRAQRTYERVTTGIYTGRPSQMRLRISNIAHTLEEYSRHVQGLKAEIEAYTASLGK